jgi:phage tail-like protein
MKGKTTPSDADATTQSDLDKGNVNIAVGFAPLRPAEFVIIRFQQLAGRFRAAIRGQARRRAGVRIMTSMAQDPYRGFRFKVKWDGRYVAGIDKVSALRRSTEVVEHREGGEPAESRKLPGRTKFEAIALERGITQDRAFEEWANSVLGMGTTPAGAIPTFKKDIAIDIFNEDDVKVLSYLVHRCWVSEYEALPSLDANSDAVAIERIKLEHDGWERDTSVVPPEDTP